MSDFIFPYQVGLLCKQEINPDVFKFHQHKPYGYRFTPEKVDDLNIDQDGYESEVVQSTITNTTDSSFDDCNECTTTQLLAYIGLL